MKKIIIPIVIIIQSFCLWGCVQQEKSQYDETTNQHTTVHGISFQVPSEWKKEYDNEEYLAYLELKKNGNLKI